MFLLNSRLDHFSAPSVASRGPFSRSYGSNLPSSLTVIHSSALVLYTRPPVSVCGTGAAWICLADFLGSLLTSVIGSPRGISVLSGSTLTADLPAAIDVYTLQPELPFPGRTVTSPSPHRSVRQCRNINRLFHRSRRSA